MPILNTPNIFDGVRLWRSSTEKAGLYLMYALGRSFLPITDAGDVDESRWSWLSGVHHDTWNQLTIEQQQTLREHAKVLVVAWRLAGGEI